jgi:hypothetical protein
MTRTVQVRLDARAEADLALLRSEGHNDSDAIRLALAEGAARRRRREALRLEAQRAANDPDDLAEARRVRAALDEIADELAAADAEFVAQAARQTLARSEW